ncbi:MAG: PEP-CTERM sorting domain-containing protein, partial [Planctomycetales bacterium]|nr:PEP-CTERM sorting domain-containing protein [Planctomycetales bacterium]
MSHHHTWNHQRQNTSPTTAWRIIMARIPSALSFLLIHLSSVASQGAPVGIDSITATGSTLETFTAGAKTYFSTNLIGATMTAFSSNNAGNLLIPNGGALPVGSARSDMLGNDLLLNTGVINPGTGNTSVSLQFASPLINGDGAELVVFEMSTGTPDPISIVANGNTVNVVGADYSTVVGSTGSVDVYSRDGGNPSNLSQLENDTYSLATTVTQNLYGFVLDLDDFGVAPFGSISSLTFGSSANGDPVLFMGINSVPVPEPSSFALLGLGCIGFVFRRCRRAGQAALLLLVAALLNIGTPQAQAARLVADNFDTYTAGNLAGNNGGFEVNGAWTSAYSSIAQANVVSGGLNYSNGSINLNGGAQSVALTAGSDSAVSRSFSPQTGTVYFSVLYQPVAGFDVSDHIQFALSDDADVNNAGSIGKRSTSNLFARIRSTSDTNGDTGTNAVQGVTNLLVGKISKNASTNYNRLELFIDPASLTEPGVPDATVNATLGIDTLSSFVIRTAVFDGGDQMNFDLLQIGTTFDSVVTQPFAVPEPTAAALLGLGLLGLATRRRRRVCSGTAPALAAALMACLASLGQAAPIAFDDFENYAPGSDLNGQSAGNDFTTAWTSAVGEVTAQNGVIPGLGRSMQIDTLGDNANLVRRSFPAQTGTFYVGLTLRTAGGMDASDFLQLYFNDDNSAADTSASGLSGGIRNAAGTPFFARIDGTANTTNSSTAFSADDVTNRLVFKFTKSGGDYDTVSLFVNQASEGIADAVQATGASGVSTIDTFHLRTAVTIEEGQFFYLDAFAVGANYTDAVRTFLVPEPTTLSMLGIGLIGLVGRRRRGGNRQVALPAIVLATIFTASSAHALVVADFNDLTGGGVDLQGQAGGTGLDGNWAGSTSHDVIAGDLTSSLYNITQSGTPQRIDGDSGATRTTYRNLTAPVTGDVWFSMLVQNDAADSRGGIHMNNTPATPFDSLGDMWAVFRGTDLVVDFDPGGSGATLTNQINLGETVLLVGHMVINSVGNDTVELFVNPTKLAFLDELTPTYSSTTTDFASSLDSIGLATYHTGSGIGGDLDALRLGTFFEVTAVVALPEPSTAMLGLLSLIG